jgi:hypothetical protein
MQEYVRSVEKRVVKLEKRVKELGDVIALLLARPVEDDEPAEPPKNKTAKKKAETKEGNADDK